MTSKLIAGLVGLNKQARLSFVSLCSSFAALPARISPATFFFLPFSVVFGGGRRRKRSNNERG
jgi:hypothetical protein